MTSPEESFKATKSNLKILTLQYNIMKNSADTQVTNSETIENNKLIAEFMGYSFKMLPDTDNQCYELSGSWDIIHVTEFEIGCFAYHSDWNRLMPVVERIESLGYYTNSDIGFTGSDNKTVMHFFRVYKNGYEGINIAFSKSTFKIESIYTAVIEFIKWYNDNK